MNLKICLLNVAAKLPLITHPGEDAAFDIFTVEGANVPPGMFHHFKTGFSAEIEQGYYVQLQGRSGLARDYGIIILGGVIDSGYRGEWVVICYNAGPKHWNVEAGDKIAQGVVHFVPMINIKQVDFHPESERSTKGFGSSGR